MIVAALPNHNVTKVFKKNVEVKLHALAGGYAFLKIYFEQNFSFMLVI